MVIQLLAGMFLGSAAASLVWGAVLFVLKSKNDKIRRERDGVMHSLGELWNEIDALVTSRHGGGRAEIEFRERFTARLDEVNRQLRPNIHILESYFVKYTEALIDYYNHKVFGDAAIAVQPTSRPIPEIEMETGLNFVETPPEALLEKVQPASPATVEVADNTFVETSPVSEIEAAESQAEDVGDVAIEPVAKAPADTSTGTKTESFSRDPDSENRVGDIVEDIFDASEAADDAAKTDKSFDVVIAGKEPVAEEAAAEKKEPSVPESAPEAEDSDDEEDVVFELKEPPAPDISATVSAGTEPGDRMFDDEEFTMETMMDVDINSLSSFLKPQNVAAETSSAPDPALDATVEMSPSILEKEKPADIQDDLEVVVASNAGHTDMPVVDETVVIDLPKEPQFAASSDNKEADLGDLDDSIPEETTYTHAEDLTRNLDSAPKPAADVVVEDDFEVLFQEGPVEVEPASAAIAATTTTEEDTGAELFEAELTDADVITGNDVADKIAALEVGPVAESSQKKNGGGSAPSSPVEKEKTPELKKSAKPVTKKSPVTTKRGGRADDSITGDDVADKMDAFFGLFDE